VIARTNESLDFAQQLLPQVPDATSGNSFAPIGFFRPRCGGRPLQQRTIIRVLQQVKDFYTRVARSKIRLGGAIFRPPRLLSGSNNNFLAEELAGVPPVAHIRARFGSLAESVRRRSIVLWGEHGRSHRMIRQHYCSSLIDIPAREIGRSGPVILIGSRPPAGRYVAALDSVQTPSGLASCNPSAGLTGASAGHVPHSA